ncbi:hypothetical protein M947_11065 [Sulfurimonas hongkongensis]|uniref:Acylneuraminate cytidylyltransferase n=1 Tax=Sulfurimonas hongkongensis TaxID=1172190 RepID=T0KCG1_9BACT|nr:hypothetical protein [Sulfurimonas hongkongensis]EQB34414.1 hypothetical protein M947_11065 [Sulfurimonas hongkongensis]
MKKAILIQARLSSTRFPNKMMHELNNCSLIEYVYNRCKNSTIANQVIVITSNDLTDDPLYDLCIKKQIPVFRGNLHDVLHRYIEASKFYNVDIICRVCGDSPFVDIGAIDTMFNEVEEKQLDYMCASQTINGFISEIVTSRALNDIYSCDIDRNDKEHVTRYIKNNKKLFKCRELKLGFENKKLNFHPLTVDYPKDLYVVNLVAKELLGYSFSSKDIVDILTNSKVQNDL